jgi:hypothetical protein
MVQAAIIYPFPALNGHNPGMFREKVSGELSARGWAWVF